MASYPTRHSADFPGRGRGYLAWQRDAVGLQQESITVIANDADGMAEAVGSLYEATAGIDPMTKYALPATSTVTPALQNGQAPELAARWQAVVPDRVLTLTAAANGDITAISLDGSSSVISKAGKVTAQQPIEVADVESAKKASAGKPVVPDTLKGKLALNRVAKFITTSNGITAVAYWGGTLQTFGGDGAVKSRQLLPQDISALTWAGNTLIVGQADGNVVALEAK